MSAERLITEHLDLWTSAVTYNRDKPEFIGIAKLRELILELAVRGKLVPQDPEDEPAPQLLERIEGEKARLYKEGKIKKPKPLSKIRSNQELFRLPRGWAWCYLNDLGSWGSGATPKRGYSEYYGGGIPWFKSGELDSDFISISEETITEKALAETSVRLKSPGDVLVAMYGATIGKASILKKYATTNQAVCACSPFAGVYNLFLLTLLKAYRNRFVEMGAGGAQPNISKEKIISTIIALPPEVEQQRIAKNVDELMALCNRLEQQTGDQWQAHETLVDALLEALTRSADATELADNWRRIAAHFDTLFTTERSIDRLEQTILRLAMMGRLVPQDPNDEAGGDLVERISSEKERLVKEGQIRRAKNLPEIDNEEKPMVEPPGWVPVRYGDITSIMTGRLDANAAVENGEYPFFTCSNNPSRIDHYEFDGQAVLLAGNGDFNVKMYSGKFNAYQRTYVITPILVDLTFLYYLTRSEINRITKNNRGSVISYLRLADIGMPVVNLPPVREQRRIAERIDELLAFCNQLRFGLAGSGETQRRLAETLVNRAGA